MISHDDPWLLPTRQADHPARPPVDASTLHGRREALFLVLATAHVFATSALLLLGARTLDLGALLARVAPNTEPSVAIAMPIGVLVLPVAFACVAIASEIYGRRRAMALVLAGAFAALGAFGLVYATSAIDLVPPVIALASGNVVAQLAHVLLFDGLRQRMRHRQLALRLLAAGFLAQLGGWAVYAFVLRGTAPETGDDAIRALALGSCAYTMFATMIAVVPVLLAVKVLELYLRVTRITRADLEDDEPASSPAWSTGRVRARMAREPESAPVSAREREPVSAPVPVREREPASAPPARREPQIRAYTSAEMRFFSEGDELTESAEAL